MRNWNCSVRGNNAAATKVTSGVWHREPPALCHPLLHGGTVLRQQRSAPPSPKLLGQTPRARTSPDAGTRGPCTAGGVGNGEERLAEHPPGHPLERYGEMGRKRAFGQKKILLQPQMLRTLPVSS